MRSIQNYSTQIIFLALIFYSASASTQGLDSGERKFQKIKEHYTKQFDGTPVNGNHKRFKRAMHYLKSRLDKDGNLINHTRANLEALEQLYIDTFPATIQGEWSEIGPVNTIGTNFNGEGEGRVNCIAFASADTWYAGTAGGGLWRTDAGGLYIPPGDYPWYPLTDSLPVMSISGIAVHPDGVDDVYILTGDGESQKWSRGNQPGVGILHSADGGTSWDTTSLQYGMSQGEAGYKLAMHPDSPDTMFAACTDGLYRTTDGWNDPSFPFMAKLIDTTCFDFEFKPGSPDTMYVARAGGLLRSFNAGSSFDNISGNLEPFTLDSTAGRISLAVTPDDPDVLYFIIANEEGGLLSFQYSIDAGESFVETINNDYNILASKDHLAETDGQGNYDLALWADPNNAGTVIVGGINIWKSTAFGFPNTWSRIFYWPDDEPPNYTHADIHEIKTTPSGKIMACTDGGLYQSSDGGIEWSKRSAGLAITQYYHFDTYIFLGFPIFSGGAQDNGTSTAAGLGPQAFEMIGGGDGFRCYRGSSDGESLRYTSVQNGKLSRHDYDEFPGWIPQDITPPAELDGDNKGMGAWDTPYQPNANNFEELIAGYDDLYYSNDAGDDWGSIAVERPTGSYDGTVLIREIAWSKTDNNALYFIISDKTNIDLWRCDALLAAVIGGNIAAGACSLVSLDNISIFPKNQAGRTFEPTDIALNASDDSEIWLSFPGFTDSMKVYHNLDFASDSPWVNITYNLPNVPVLCVEYDIDGIYAGTDIGVFYLPNGEEEWIYFSQGLPTSSVTEIEIKHTLAGKLIFASTWGRGIWWSTPPTPVRRTRWYVDISATGLNNGANWTNAFPNLQTALDTVVSGDSIWVANGTYYPSTISGFAIPGFSATNIRVLGGFNGSEDSSHQRDFIVNETILSGDIGVLDSLEDNAHHIFRFGGHNANVLLDGFHITEGYAHGAGGDNKGAGIYYSVGLISAGKPIISNCKIYNNIAPFTSADAGLGGGMYISDNKTGDPEMYIRNCTFENNYAGNRGGALYIDAYKWPSMPGTATVHLDTCVFIDNVANSEGGAIYCEGVQNSTVKLFIDSAIFNGNYVVTGHSLAGQGGGIMMDANPAGHVELECLNSVFTNQTVLQKGGAICVDAPETTSETTLKDCAFDSCHANSGGGGVYVSSYGSSAVSSLTIDGCSFTNNSNGGPGGAIYVRGHTLAHNTVLFNNTSFVNNTATGSGGAVQFNANDDGHIASIIDSCTFTNNSSDSEGGAMQFYVRKKPAGVDPLGTIDLTLSNSLFNNNTASTSAGALSLYSENAIVSANFSETDFINNVTGAGNGGGAIYHHFSQNNTSSFTASYTNCNFTGNTALTRWGGALNLQKSDVTFTGCTFTENISRRGGAIYNISNGIIDTHAQTFISCQFIRNKGTEFGGAIFNIHDDPTFMLFNVTNSLFDSNYTTLTNSNFGNGGAIYTRGSGRSVQNISTTTFADNYASKNGGAIYAGSSSGLPTPLDTLFINVDSSLFFNNDAAATGETIELRGDRLIIYSHWSNSRFYNDGANTIFLNGQNPGLGVSRATFEECYIYEDGAPSPSAAPVQLAPELFENQ